MPLSQIPGFGVKLNLEAGLGNSVRALFFVRMPESGGCINEGESDTVIEVLQKSIFPI